MEDIFPKKANVVVIKVYVSFLRAEGRGWGGEKRENKDLWWRGGITPILVCIYSSLLYHIHLDSPGHVQVVVIDKEPLFFSLRDGQYFPTLRVLHQCKFLFAMRIFQLVYYPLFPRKHIAL